jgi:hypothetical protein
VVLGAGVGGVGAGYEGLLGGGAGEGLAVAGGNKMLK